MNKIKNFVLCLIILTCLIFPYACNNSKQKSIMVNNISISVNYNLSNWHYFCISTKEDDKKINIEESNMNFNTYTNGILLTPHKKINLTNKFEICFYITCDVTLKNGSRLSLFNEKVLKNYKIIDNTIYFIENNIETNNACNIEINQKNYILQFNLTFELI